MATWSFSQKIQAYKVIEHTRPIDGHLAPIKGGHYTLAHTNLSLDYWCIYHTLLSSLSLGFSSATSLSLMWPTQNCHSSGPSNHGTSSTPCPSIAQFSTTVNQLNSLVTGLYVNIQQPAVTLSHLQHLSVFAFSKTSLNAIASLTLS
jgi:hypothetical protein